MKRANWRKGKKTFISPQEYLCIFHAFISIYSKSISFQILNLISIFAL